MRHLLFTLPLLLLSFLSFAQPPGPGDPPPEVPITEDIGVLIVAAILISIYEIRKANKKFPINKLAEKDK